MLIESREDSHKIWDLLDLLLTATLWPNALFER